MVFKVNIIYLLSLLIFNINFVPNICLAEMSRSNKSKIIIAIDIGHSRNSVGAISSRGVGEYYFNQEIARLLHDNLLKKGYSKTFFVNDKGGDLSLRERVDIANNNLAVLFISIHHDSVQSRYLQKWTYKCRSFYYCDRYAGYSIFYSGKNAEVKNAILFAKYLGKELKNSGYSPSLHHAEPIKGENRLIIDKDLGIYRVDDFSVIKSTKMPSIILECGIIVNRDEDAFLTDKKNQIKLASTIAKAVELYFNENSVVNKSLNR